MIVVVLVIIGALGFLFSIRNQPANPAQTEAPGEISSPSVVGETPLPTSSQDETGEIVEAPQPFPSDTPAFTSTETSLPTNTPEPSSTPTQTITPTSTETLLPTPTPLFFDDFTEGKSDQWQEPVYGDTDIVDNSLTFSENTLMVLSGSEEWENYKVSFDLSNIHCQGAVSSQGLSVGFRYQDPNNMAALKIFRHTECDCTWDIYENNRRRIKPNSRFPLIPADSNGVRHI